MLLVTVTVTAPALPAGVVAVMAVLFTTTTFVAAVPPNVTVAPAAKFVPVIVTAVPPAVGPVLGDTLRHRRWRNVGKSVSQTPALPAGLSPSPSPRRRYLPASWL